MGCSKIAEQIRRRNQQGCGPAHAHPELPTGSRAALVPPGSRLSGKAGTAFGVPTSFAVSQFAPEVLGHGDGHLHAPHYRLWRRRRQSQRTRRVPDVNRAIARQSMPKYVSSDHYPMFRFQCWRANLRILEIDEIKSIPGTPRSHPFIERLIGTIRREYLDQTLFWDRCDLEQKLNSYKVYYNLHRCHTGLAGITPAQRCGALAHPIANLDSYRWRKHCNSIFQTPAAD